MTKSIFDTIFDAVKESRGSVEIPDQFVAPINAATDALKDREAALVQQIIDLAEDRYGYGDKALLLLGQLGMYLPAKYQPVPGVETTTPASVGENGYVTEGVVGERVTTSTIGDPGFPSIFFDEAAAGIANDGSIHAETLTSESVDSTSEQGDAEGEAHEERPYFELTIRGQFNEKAAGLVEKVVKSF